MPRDSAARKATQTALSEADDGEDEAPVKPAPRPAAKKKAAAKTSDADQKKALRAERKEANGELQSAKRELREAEKAKKADLKEIDDELKALQKRRKQTEREHDQEIRPLLRMQDKAHTRVNKLDLKLAQYD